MPTGYIPRPGFALVACIFEQFVMKGILRLDMSAVPIVWCVAPGPGLSRKSLRSLIYLKS